MIDVTDKDTILCIAAHCDDAELGAGATISKLVGKGARVVVVAFSDARESLRDGYEPLTLRNECRRSLDVLGIEPDDVLIKEFKVREFPGHRQKILEYLYMIGAKYDPSLVITHSVNDKYQDHEVVARETRRVFHCSVVSTVLPWNTTFSNTSLFIEVDSIGVEKKVSALRQYKSQQHRHYFQEEYVRSWLRATGLKARCDYAEEFEVMRIIK